MPVTWLEQTLWALGLEPHRQPFARTLPFPDEARERYVSTILILILTGGSRRSPPAPVTAPRPRGRW